jgi:transcription antitermination factor NusG
MLSVVALYPVEEPSYLSVNGYHWFALAVKPRHEKVVAEQLHTKNLEEYLPLYRARRSWSDRMKVVDLPLFPGYVFCRFGIAQKMRVERTFSVNSIVGFGNCPAPIPDSEIAAIKSVVDSTLPVQPWPFLRAGQQVRIDGGCMAGLEGTLIQEKGIYRVVVGVELLQRSVAVEIDRDLVRAVEGPEYSPWVQIYMIRKPEAALSY